MYKIIKVQGSHSQCGEQVGEACRDQLKEIISQSRNKPPEGSSWEECLKSALPYIAATIQDYPYIVKEIEGCARGVGADSQELFAAAIDELWMKPVITTRHCSDVVACPPATTTEIWVGHNNDLSPGQVDLITAVEWKINGKPAMFTVGPGGIFVSVGINEKGISLTGSELNSTDNKIGIPGAFVARAVLNAGTFDEAVKTALNPNRASSYNNIICTPDLGQAVAIEGSATEYELIYPENGLLVHTNHYLSPKMKKFEGHPNYDSSIERQNRLEKILLTAKRPISKNTILDILRDHGEDGIPSDNTICRHSLESETTFSTLFNLTRGSAEIAFGYPCQNEFHEVWRFSS